MYVHVCMYDVAVVASFVMRDGGCDRPPEMQKPHQFSKRRSLGSGERKGGGTAPRDARLRRSSDGVHVQLAHRRPREI